MSRTKKYEYPAYYGKVRKGRFTLVSYQLLDSIEWQQMNEKQLKLYFLCRRRCYAKDHPRKDFPLLDVVAKNDVFYLTATDAVKAGLYRKGSESNLRKDMKRLIELGLIAYSKGIDSGPNRKKIYKRTDKYIECLPGKYTLVTYQLEDSAAWNGMSKKQMSLFFLCRRQCYAKYRPANDFPTIKDVQGNDTFYLTRDDAVQAGLYKKGSSQNLGTDIRRLMALGLIELVSCIDGGYGRNKKKVYRLSCNWIQNDKN